MRFIATVAVALLTSAVQIVSATECRQVDLTSAECVTVQRTDDAYVQIDDHLHIIGVHKDAQGNSPWQTTKDVRLHQESVSGQPGANCDQNVNYEGAMLTIGPLANGTYPVTVAGAGTDQFTASMHAVPDPAGNDLWLTDVFDNQPKPDRRHYIFFRRKPLLGGDLPKYLYVVAFDKDCWPREPVIGKNVKAEKVTKKQIAADSPNPGLDETGVGGGGEQK